MRKQSVAGVRPPTKSCRDPDCPWHGTISIRGKLLYGRLASLKAKGLAVLERDYYQYVPKYSRYEKRRSRVHAHIPPCVSAEVGDNIVAAECRPLAKTVSFVVLGGQGE
ncbi:MAG: 30S ribosomal protein S17 [Conexivisphaerales archaeon]